MYFSPAVTACVVAELFTAAVYKLNQDRRHHIPRQRHEITNWPATTPACANAGA